MSDTDNTLECQICYEDIEEEHKCDICKISICKDCYNSKDVALNEWLIINNICKVCKKKGCPECLFACFNCCNLYACDDTITELDIEPVCKNCSKLKKSTCEYHIGYYCKKCAKKKIECTECKADKNYVNRHSMF